MRSRGSVGKFDGQRGHLSRGRIGGAGGTIATPAASLLHGYTAKQASVIIRASAAGIRLRS